jgi:hypothetical protein
LERESRKISDSMKGKASGSVSIAQSRRTVAFVYYLICRSGVSKAVTTNRQIAPTQIHCRRDGCCVVGV